MRLTNDQFLNSTAPGYSSAVYVNPQSSVAQTWPLNPLGLRAMRRRLAFARLSIALVTPGDLEQYPLLAERVGCSARTKVSPRSGAVLTLGPIARSFALPHTDYTRQHTPAAAGAIRSS